MLVTAHADDSTTVSQSHNDVIRDVRSGRTCELSAQARHRGPGALVPTPDDHALKITGEGVRAAPTKIMTRRPASYYPQLPTRVMTGVSVLHRSRGSPSDVF
jgi:hypothetical protein